MKKQLIHTATIALSLLTLTACGNTDESKSATIGTIQPVTKVAATEPGTREAAYRNMYEDSETQFKAGKNDEAAGTIQILLQNDLSGYAELEEKALKLKEEITLAQAEAAKAAEEKANKEVSAYIAERESEVAAEEFQKAVGKDIQEATDEEIENWLAAKEEILTESPTEDTETKEEQDISSMTFEEEQSFVLNEIVSITGLSPAENQFYSVKMGDDTYRVEIRHAHEVEGIEVSNLIGIFEYKLSERSLKKMDPMTGQFKDYSEGNLVL